MKNVLILGGSGLLGTNLACYLRVHNNIILGMHKRVVDLPGCQSLVIQNIKSDLLHIIVKKNIQVVINTIGLTSVEKCEENPQLSYEINVEAVKMITEVCEIASINLIQISTDHLYSSEKKLLHNENSEVSPINTYGKHKLEGEKPVLMFEKGCVLRTNFFGIGSTYRKSFSDFILDKLKNEENISLFKDVFYTPVSTRTISNVIIQIINNDLVGLFNISCNELITKLEFGVLLAKKFKLNDSLIDSISITSKKNLVLRPHQMGLDNSKLRKVLPNIDLSLDTIIEEFYKDYSALEFNFIKNLI